jgi:orotate phosphoribosyltransferase
MDSRLPSHAAFLAQRERLRDLLATHSVRREPVVLASGKSSDFYVDCKQTSLRAEGHFLIGQLLRAGIDQLAPEAEGVGGLTLGADPIASAVSLMSFLAGKPLEGFIIRKEPKGHGTGAWIEGASGLRPGAPVVIVEDVVTTGGSTLRAIERARASDLSIACVFALVDREEGGREAVEREAPLYSIFSRTDFDT